MFYLNSNASSSMQSLEKDEIQRLSSKEDKDRRSANQRAINCRSELSSSSTESLASSLLSFQSLKSLDLTLFEGCLLRSTTSSPLPGGGFKPAETRETIQSTTSSVIVEAESSSIIEEVDDVVSDVEEDERGYSAIPPGFKRVGSTNAKNTGGKQPDNNTRGLSTMGIRAESNAKDSGKTRQYEAGSPVYLKKNYVSFAKGSGTSLHYQTFQKGLPKKPKPLTSDFNLYQPIEQQFFQELFFSSLSYCFPYYSYPDVLNLYDSIYIDVAYMVPVQVPLTVPLPIPPLIKPMRRRPISIPNTVLKPRSDPKTSKLNREATVIKPQIRVVQHPNVTVLSEIKGVSENIGETNEHPKIGMATSKDIILSQSEEHLDEYLKEIQEIIDCVNAVSECNSILIC